MRGAETDFGETGFRLRIIFQLDVARKDFFGPVGAARHDDFIHPKINSAGGEADDKIRRAQAPQTHAGGAERGEFVMPCVLRERIQQREQ